MQSVSPTLIALARRRNHLGSFSYFQRPYFRRSRSISWSVMGAAP
jgi:hypothetical protein